MDRGAIEVAKKIKESLERKGIRVEKIILFGSRLEEIIKRNRTMTL